MTERLHPNARLHLADRLSEQVEKASGEDLLAEAAQDFGDRRALAKEFDRALARAVAQERNRRFGDRLAELALHLLTPSWSHLMGAVALAVVVIAGALYLMERSRLGPTTPKWQLRAKAWRSFWPNAPKSVRAQRNVKPQSVKYRPL